MKVNHLLLPIAFAFLTGCTAQKKAFQETDYAQVITGDALKKHLTIVAGAEMEGRNTPSRGLDKAANYLADELKKAGVTPGNNGSYFQPYTLAKDKSNATTLELNGQKFTEGFSIFMKPEVNNISEKDDLVYVGYGIVDGEINDYKNIDIKDKIVVMLQANPKDYKGKFTNFTKFRHPLTQGAKGVVLVSKRINTMAANYRPVNNNAKAASTASNPMNMGTMIMIGDDIVHAASGIGIDELTAMTDDKSAPMGWIDQKLKLNISNDKEFATVNNVVGIVEGSDKKDEYIVVSAHYDHEGIKNGQIYYGADDDGSGTVSVLQMATAFAKAKAEGKGPRRTMVFLFVSGEEKGLWGSEFYASNPIFPLAKTSANLNIDMIGRIGDEYAGGKPNAENYVYVIGDDKLSSDLTPITEMVNNKYAKMHLDRKYNDPKDPERIYYRSDHWNFAKNGVPAIFYFNGIHPDYHKPTDTVDKINFPLMAKRAQLVFYTAWEMANRENMVKRDIPLPK
ncbi:MAG: M28 family peptidase [Chitinophagaceae bacterium]|nr:MAG: M28 family peptidase [Chitinophagaceae bacterium]